MPYKCSDKFKKAVADQMKQSAVSRLPSAPPEELIEDLQTVRMLASRQYTPPATIVPNLCREGETILLIGPPKQGKSCLMLQLGLCLTAPKPFLGITIPAVKRVLYIDIEEKPADADERLAMMTHHNQEIDNFVLYTPREIFESKANLSKSDGMAVVGRMINLSRPDVMIIDPLRLFMGESWDECKAKDIIHMYRCVSIFRKKYPKLTIIIIHHTRKSDIKGRVSLRIDPGLWLESASGHYALIAHCQIAWGFTREIQPDESEQIIFNGVARSSRVPLFLLEHCNDLTFRRLQGEEFATAIMTVKEKQAWETARTLTRFHFAELEKQTGLPGRIIAGMVKKAQALGLLTYAEGQWLVILDALKTEQSTLFWDT